MRTGLITGTAIALLSIGVSGCQSNPIQSNPIPVTGEACCDDPVIVKTEKVVHEVADCALPVSLLNYKDPCVNCGNMLVTVRENDVCAIKK